MTFALCRYLATVVNSDEVLEGACDSDGEVIGQESSLFAVFEFVSALGESGHWQQLLLPVLPQLLQLLILLMQITQEQVRGGLEVGGTRGWGRKWVG